MKANPLRNYNNSVMAAERRADDAADNARAANEQRLIQAAELTIEQHQARLADAEPGSAEAMTIARDLARAETELARLRSPWIDGRPA